MRKLIVVMVLTGLFASMAFAQQNAAEAPAGQSQEASQTAKALETAAGTVDSLSPISPETGSTEGSVIIVDAAGNALNFIINTNTVVLDESANKIDSGDIMDGDKVNISYSKSDMGSIAATISRIRK